MSKESKRKQTAYTIQEKFNVIERIRKGARQAEIARELNLPESTLRGWVKNEDKLRQFVDNFDNEKGMARKRARTSENTNLDKFCDTEMYTYAEEFYLKEGEKALAEGKRIETDTSSESNEHSCSEIITADVKDSLNVTEIAADAILLTPKVEINFDEVADTNKQTHESKDTKNIFRPSLFASDSDSEEDPNKKGQRTSPAVGDIFTVESLQQKSQSNISKASDKLESFGNFVVSSLRSMSSERQDSVMLEICKLLLIPKKIPGKFLTEIEIENLMKDLDEENFDDSDSEYEDELENSIFKDNNGVDLDVSVNCDEKVESLFKWKKVEDSEAIHVLPFLGEVGLKGDESNYKNENDFFKLMFKDEILSILVEEINSYSFGSVVGKFG